MIKPRNLNKGDKVAIVSLSRGILGMPFCKHELDIALKRLKEMGLVPVIMPNALKDMDYIEKHPEARASDLKKAFMDEKYYNEYKEVYRKVFEDLDTPVLFNVNFGHSVPRCIIPYDAEATIDYDKGTIFINSRLFGEG